VALAFITGWAVRRVAQPRPSAMPPALRWSTAGLLTLVLASTVVVGSIAAAENMVTTPAELFSVLVSRQYLAAVGPLTAAMLLAEGLVLMTIAAETCAGDRVRRETVLRLMVFGATAAAAINLLRLVFAALGQENPVSLFGTYFFTRRVNVHYSDLNAAGSYFGMMLLIATGFVVRARALAISAAALIAAAVWLTGSRTAMAAVFATALAGGLLAFRGRPAVSRMRIAAGLAVLVLAAGGVWMTYPKGRNAAGDWSMSTRVELAKAGLNMTAREPIFGVGIGRFYTLSNEYAGTMLAAQGKVRENAHNYYLQVLAELGVSGLILFLTVIVLALREAWRASDTWGPQRALFAGLVVFLITCMAGHPLLVAGAAMVFWMALGLSAAPGANPPASASRRMQVAAIVLLALIVAAVPLRTAAAAKFANLEHVTIGFSRWQTQPDGVRYRAADRRFTSLRPPSRCEFPCGTAARALSRSRSSCSWMAAKSIACCCRATWSGGRCGSRPGRRWRRGSRGSISKRARRASRPHCRSPRRTRLVRSSWVAR
jgi:O-antigen ligase